MLGNIVKRMRVRRSFFHLMTAIEAFNMFKSAT